MNAGTLLVFMFLAFMATEGTVEYFLGVLFDKIKLLSPYKWVLMYFSAIVGVFLALQFQMDLFKIIGLEAVDYPWLGAGLTGLLLGRGANFINDVWQRFFPSGNGR